MKIIYQGDLHLRSSTPANRIDNYQQTQFDKLQQLVDFANENGAYLFLGGDIFDSPRVSAEVVNETIRILNGVSKGIVACLGQHDVPYHQVLLEKSPVYSLVTGETIEHCHPANTIYFEEEDIVVHLVSWEAEVDDPFPDIYNILLGHISVFEDSIPFYWKGEAYTAKTLKQKYPGFDLYLCGDIHVPFVKDDVVVSGPMLRNSIDLIGYRPRCYLIDTDDNSIKPLYYQIKYDVFSVPEIENVKGLDLQPLIEAMKSSAGLKASYKKDCFAAVENDRVKKIMKEIFDELD